jgi:signal-transduction protein with cAMP-binding, CBS, and nucleotidyltransferase domain
MTTPSSPYQGLAHSAPNSISHRRNPVRSVSTANTPTQAIRKRIESELARKRTISSAHQSASRAKRPAKSVVAKGTVAALKPSPALTVPDNITVAEASQLCAAKRTDCVLVVDDEEGLSGIFTAKDLAYRVCTTLRYSSCGN